MSQRMTPMGLDDIAAQSHDECRLAIPVDYAGVSMGLVAPILRSAPHWVYADEETVLPLGNLGRF
jgi:glutaconate CoA-transferase subunit A